MLCKEKGLLVGRALKIMHMKEIDGADSDGQAKPTHQNIIRLAPPLVITEEEIESALSIIKEAMEELPNLKGEKEKEVLTSAVGLEKNVHIGVDN
jgi:ornithine--oxo-acid transaminase